MNICVSADQLRRALADIESAEANGFMHCLAVFDIVSAGRQIDQCRGEYSDLIERAHPTNGNLNWGRFQGVTAKNRFAKGKLIPLK